MGWMKRKCVSCAFLFRNVSAVLFPLSRPLEIIVREPKVIAQLEADDAALKQQYKDKEQEVYRMGLYASLSLQYLDMLKEAKEVLDLNGMDSSFIKIR